MKKTFFVLLFSILFFLPSFALAQPTSSSWSIENLNTTTKVNQDSSLNVTENVVANCQYCLGQHGIFRTLPTAVKLDSGKTILNPVRLESITDFNNIPLPYTTLKDDFNHTITWKIGDPNVTITGINDYKINYTVDNAIRFNHPNFDEFYWNILGNEWDMSINNFTSTIVFPNDITKSNSAISYYTGKQGSQDNNLADYTWLNDNTLQFKSNQEIYAGQGITSSVTFPKNIIFQQKFSFMYLYGVYLWAILPVLTFFVLFEIWWIYGRDPKLHETTVVEFSVPNNLSPLEMGALINNGYINGKTITAHIINLAVNKIIKIQEIPKVGLFGSKDYEITLIKEPKSTLDKLLAKKIFEGDKKILLSKLGTKFHKFLPDIISQTQEILIKEKLFNSRSFILTKVFLIGGLSLKVAGILFLAYFFNKGDRTYNSIFISIALISSGLISFFFSPLMKQRTKGGARLLQQTKGFELYMKTAEKYRQQFNEKENIYERYLPYAILFGLTKQWAKKMKELYGEKYFTNYSPVWFIGLNSGVFDIDNFTSDMNSISSRIGSATSSPSGAGGGGFSGGGGGGGGGGGW